MKKRLLPLALLAIPLMLCSFTDDEKETPVGDDFNAILWDQGNATQISGTVSNDVINLYSEQPLKNIEIKVQNAAGNTLYDQVLGLPRNTVVQIPVTGLSPNGGNTIKVVVPETEEQEGETLEGEF